MMTPVALVKGAQSHLSTAIASRQNARVNNATFLEVFQYAFQLEHALIVAFIQIKITLHDTGNHRLLGLVQLGEELGHVLPALVDHFRAGREPN